MSAGDFSGNRNAAGSGSSSAELITYKRRKHSKHPSSNQVTNDQKSKAYIHDVDERVKQDCSVLQTVTYYTVHEHWKKVLERMLQSPNVSEAGIENCLKGALASGVSGFISNKTTSKRTAQEEEISHCHEDGHTNQQNQSPGQSEQAGGSESAVNKFQIVASDLCRREQKEQAIAHSVTGRCQSVLLDILISEKFSLLCNLLCKNFQGMEADEFFDFRLINSRMAKGQYEESSELFASDIQQVWKKFANIGEEMVHLAKSLSDTSSALYFGQVVDMVNGSVGEWKDKAVHQVALEQKDSLIMNRKQPPCNLLDACTKPEHSDAGGLNKTCICKHCGTEADGKRRLICDGCEAMYHISCIKPPVEEIPSKNWYCSSCSASGKQSPEPDSAHSEEEVYHQNCVVCKRLNNNGNQAWDVENHIGAMVSFDDTEELSDSSAENDRLRESQRIINSRLCKLCKTGEEDDKKFLVCEHKQCPYKYYHRRCLRYKQINCPGDRWYCPSCLCRSCSINKDDDKIVLCDGCDEAYHIYCMVPPRSTIPKGHWYCMFCMIEIRARHRLEIRYEGFVNKQIKKTVRKVNGAAGGSVDMLLSAAEKLNSEDKPVSRRRTW